MNTITIKSQSEWDALPRQFEAYTVLQLCGDARLDIFSVPGNAHAVLRDNAHAVLRDNAHAVLGDNAHAVLWDNAHAVLRDNARAELWDNARAVLWDNAHAVLRDNAHAELWDNAHAVLRDNAHAVLWDNAHAVLRDNAHAVLWGNAFCRLVGSRTVADLGGASIGLIQSPGAIAIRKSPDAHILQAPEPEWTVSGWIERDGVTEVNGEVIIYKRVSREYLTQEGTSNQTEWKPGTTVTHPAWNPEKEECGSGKFHGCSRPYFADEFRNVEDDRYVAVRVKTADLYAWPNPMYPHKIAFREGVVLHECDRYGEEIKA